MWHSLFGECHISLLSDIKMLLHGVADGSGFPLGGHIFR